MTSIGTYWRTLKHLKPIQLAGRARFRLLNPAPDLRPAPALRAAAGNWFAPARREASMLGPTRLRFLNEEHDLDACGWDHPGIERLWRYNLHYFDDLNARDAVERRLWHAALIDRWLKENPPGRGTAWEPYPTSLRIVNWIKWFLQGAPAREHWIHSLAVQARWLRRRLEWHLLGNHLFANAKALMFAGLFFDGDEAQAWFSDGQRIIERELREQVLDDGGHFERSPMYHALFLEDVLDLLDLIGARAPSSSPARNLEPVLRASAAAMLRWLRCMSHPDGSIALFNDAAEGVAPANAELETYAARLGISAPHPPREGITVLESSGYVRIARGAAVALLDIAPLGPDYLLGHGHADTLSFELSVGGRRVVVNGGTSRYGLSEQRLRERGTAWHSTVEVAGVDSSEVWSGFRVGRRARPGPIRVNGWDVEGVHDGYCFLHGSPVHRRRWSMGAGELAVEDAVRPDFHPAIARFHLAPGLALVPTGSAKRWHVRDHASDVAHIEIEVGDARASTSQHAPRFGVLMPVQTLEVTLAAGKSRCLWQWTADAHPVSD
ncbi:MAG: heparinase II/III family protein [Thermaurantiacus sp.]